MDLILDTTVLIEAEQDGTQLDAVVGDEDAVSIAAVTYAELLHGVEMADGRRRQRRQAFVEAVAAATAATYDLAVVTSHAGGFENLPGVAVRHSA